MLSNQWKKTRKNGEELLRRVFTIPSDSTIFQQYYDEVQELLQLLAGMDELISGITLGLYLTTLYSVLFIRNVEQEQRSGASDCLSVTPAL